MSNFGYFLGYFTYISTSGHTEVGKEVIAGAKTGQRNKGEKQERIGRTTLERNVEAAVEAVTEAEILYK